MELLTSLPADLAVFADPSARGPAPLLRPPDAAGAPAVAATPFELCLALLTTGPPAGEPWPASGKELPALALDSPDGDAAGLDPAALLAFAPAALAAAALQARLPSGAEPTPALPAATTLSQTPGTPLPPTEAAPALPPLPSGETGTADAGTSSQGGELDLLATLTNADAASLPLEAAEPPPGTAVAKAALPPSWLEAFTREGRVQRPLAATAAEQRAAAAPAPPPVAALQPNTATAAVVEVTAGAQAQVRRVEGAKVLASAVTATDGAGPADWLPQPTGHSAATGGTAAAPAAAPQAPVDLRSPGWQEAFANRVQVLVDTQIGEARIKLNPPELGAVDVKISLVDDKTYVQLTTVTAAARDELAQSLPRLRELFTGSGLELGGASVHHGRDGQPGGNGSGADRATANAAPFASFAADRDAPPLVPRRALGRIDVFA